MKILIYKKKLITFLQCSVGAQVNIDEDAANGSADEASIATSAYGQAADGGDRHDNNPLHVGFGGRGEGDMAAAAAVDKPQLQQDSGPIVSSCQTCLIQQPIQATLMGVH